MMVAFVCGAVAAVGIFGAVLSDAARYGCALLFSLVIGVIPPAVMSGVPRYARSPAVASSLQGLVVQLSNLGIFVAAPLVAVVVSLTGRWEAAITVLLVAAAIGIAVSSTIARIEQARPVPAALP